MSTHCIDALAERQTRDFRLNRDCGCDPMRRHILDADCVHEDGGFQLLCLPENLPDVFTVRFTAPADFSTGDRIFVLGRGCVVYAQSMAVAPAGIFKAGAVILCEIDRERDYAFLCAGANGGAIDMSTEEQFAGYHDLEGKRVYCKTIGPIVVKWLQTGVYHYIDHGIANAHRLMRVDDFYLNAADPNCNCANGGSAKFLFDNTSHQGKLEVFVLNVLSNYTGYFTLYYTCTDR